MNVVICAENMSHQLRVLFIVTIVIILTIDVVATIEEFRVNL